MYDDYEFRPCRPEEAAEVFRLVCERIRWMDEVGIRQWNHTDYLNVFPRSYYEIQQAEGALYALCERQTGKLAAAAVLLTEDERWQGDTAPALYIHNLVGAPDCPGAGKEFLRRTEEMALRMGKRYLRLDSTRDNEPSPPTTSATASSPPANVPSAPTRAHCGKSRSRPEPKNSAPPPACRRDGAWSVAFGKNQASTR